ncbi:MAG TPA: prohibitin family protein, partial [Candidatus Binatia bacterium]|nr:prohibitin family protein [Candidatus Binatia bacterium]
VAIGLGVLALVRAGRNQNAKGIGSTVVVVLVLAAILSTLGAGLVYVESNERGVVKTIRAGGVRPAALEPGLHWILPIIEQVVTYSISNQTYTMSATPNEGQVQGDDSIRARTKDGQEVILDASVIYQIDPNKVVPLHIAWQQRYQDGIVRPESRGIIRDAVAQYGVEEVVSSKREEMTQYISDRLSESLSNNNLRLIDFVLRDIHFSEEYAAAVEQKQIAEQQAQQARLTVEQRKQEAEQARQVAQGQADAAVIAAQGAAEAQIIQAEAQAQANELIGQSLQENPEILQYQYILKLSPGVQTIFIPSGNQFILPLPNTTTTTTTVVPTPAPTTTP